MATSLLSSRRTATCLSRKSLARTAQIARFRRVTEKLNPFIGAYLNFSHFSIPESSTQRASYCLDLLLKANACISR